MNYSSREDVVDWFEQKSLQKNFDSSNYQFLAAKQQISILESESLTHSLTGRP